MSSLKSRGARIQHYGVEIDGRRYDGPGLNEYRRPRSAHGGAQAGKWPFHGHRNDVRTCTSSDPAAGSWHRLQSGSTPPAHRRPVLRRRRPVRPSGRPRTHRHVDPAQAVADLLDSGQRTKSPIAATGILRSDSSATRAELGIEDESGDKSIDGTGPRTVSRRR